MDDIRTCRWCRKIYQGLGEHFCPECVQKMDDAFIEIRAYLDDHPQANAAEIIKKTGLEEKIVIQLLRDERLSEYSNGSKQCEVCHRTIKSGKLCDDCKNMMKKFIDKNQFERNTKRPYPNDKADSAKETIHGKAARAIRMYDE